MFSRSTNPAHPAWQWHRLWYRLLVQNVRRLPFFILQTRFPSEIPDAPCPVFAGFGDADAGAVGDGFCEDDGSTVKVSVASSGGQVLYWPSSWSCSLALRSFDVWLPHVRRFLKVHKTGFICACPAGPSVI